MTETKIEWTDVVWNPVTGCTRVSSGCDNCYAFSLHDKRHVAQANAAKRALEATGRITERGSGNIVAQARALDIPLPLPKQYDLPFSTVQLHPERLTAPLHWRKPRRVFVNSMSDLFHEDVPDDFIDRVFATMALTPQHTYQCLTKRPERMRDYMDGRLDRGARPGPIWKVIYDLYAMSPERHQPAMTRLDEAAIGTPLPNVWLGVSAEDQATLDARVPLLLETPAAVRFVSAEPLLGPLDLRPRRYFDPYRRWLRNDRQPPGPAPIPERGLDWVIVGGESGAMRRPNGAERALVEPCEVKGFHWYHPFCTGWRPKTDAFEWVRSIRDQCAAAGVAFFFKQWGGPTPKAGGRLLDGRTWDEMPDGILSGLRRAGLSFKDGTVMA